VYTITSHVAFGLKFAKMVFANARSQTLCIGGSGTVALQFGSHEHPREDSMPKFATGLPQRLMAFAQFGRLQSLP
jgi:hypothetical protein